MSRVTCTIEFPFTNADGSADDYKVVMVFVDGVAEEIGEVTVRDGATWKPVAHPSPELFTAIGEALQEYAKAEARRAL